MSKIEWGRHAQFYLFLRSKRDQLLEGVAADGDVLGLGYLGGAAIAGTDEDLVYESRAGELPGEGMLSAAASEDQDAKSHGRTMGET